MRGKYEYRRRAFVMLAGCIFLPCMIIFCIFAKFRINKLYENFDMEMEQIIEVANDNASEISNSISQKARFIIYYSKLNDILQQTEQVKITSDTIQEKREIDNVINALFAESNIIEASVYTTNYNANSMSIIKYIKDDSDFEDISEDSVGMWRMEDNGWEKMLSFYKKYRVMPDYYNVIKISIPFKSITDAFSNIKYENTYIKVGDVVFTYDMGKYRDSTIPDGNFYKITGKIDPINFEVEVNIDTKPIHGELLKLVLYLLGGLIVQLIIIFGVSSFLSDRLLRGITDLVESIRTNNMELIKNSAYKSKEIDIIKEYLIELQTKLKNENEEKLKFESDMLMERISPHFLYNNLSAIKSNCVNEKSRQAIDKLVRYYRNVFQKGNQMTTIKCEIENGVEYLQLMQFSYERDFDIDVKIEKGCESFDIPSNIIQPILENAFIYGINDKEEDFHGIISINAYKENDDLLISIIDNGGNFDKERYLKKISDNTKRHATAMIIARMKLYYKDDKYTLQIFGNKEYTESLFRFGTII
ncbi:MAG: histidine kinase [Clostridia bacterium]|nr:histidine kinase [Clostridia bacterium]